MALRTTRPHLPESTYVRAGSQHLLEGSGGMVYGCRRLITLCSSCARLLWLPGTIYLPFSIALWAGSLGGYPCAWAAQVQANGEPPTRVSVAFGNSEEQLRGRNREETNEPSDEIRCTSLSEFLSRVVNQVCSPHQQFDAGIHVRMSYIPFLAAVLVERESRSFMTRHSRGPVPAYWPLPR